MHERQHHGESPSKVNHTKISDMTEGIDMSIFGTPPVQKKSPNKISPPKPKPAKNHPNYIEHKSRKMSIPNSRYDLGTQRPSPLPTTNKPFDPKGDPTLQGTTLQEITEAVNPAIKGALRLAQLGTKESDDDQIPTKTEAIANFGQQISRVLDDDTLGGNLQSATLKKTMTELLVSNNIATNYNAMKEVAKGRAGTLEHSIKRFNRHMGNPLGDTEVHTNPKFLVNNSEEVSVQRFITENMHV
jgi:hypothetical protein